MDIKICIIGIGYVGCISAACISKLGYQVICVDKDNLKVDSISKGLATVTEKDVDSMISEGVKSGLISATTDLNLAVMESTHTFICVDTPNTSNGMLNHEHIFFVAREIGKALSCKNSYHTVLIRSTTSPGTGEIVEDIIEKYSKKKRKIDFDVVSNPEFLREGEAVKDFFDPGMTILGFGSDCNPIAKKTLLALYAKIKAPIYQVERRSSEIIKYVNNSWHAVKISFANEVSKVCNSVDVDPIKVMQLFAKDKKLNISDKYLKPGFAYGGSCLPKDILGLVSLANAHEVEMPLLRGAISTNDMLIDQAYKIIIDAKYKNIAFIGLAFKDGTDDLRGSPLLAVARMLEKKMLNVDYYDDYISKSIYKGVGKKNIKTELGSIYGRLHGDISDVLKNKELVVIGCSVNDNILSNSSPKLVIDLVNAINKKTVCDAGIAYQGLNW
jgi:GDP-mannose 6-dehydrogenase